MAGDPTSGNNLADDNASAGAVGGIGKMADAASTSRDPAVALPAVAALRRLADDLETLHVANARRLGWPWREIAEALGVTKQTVHRKHRGS